MSSQPVTQNSISEDRWHFPMIGDIPTSEYRILRRLLHEIGRRNIYMRYKYVARFYHSGILEKMVETLNTTSQKRKRKRTNKEDDLPDAKRQTIESSTEEKSSTEEEEDDGALTDYDSNDGDSSDEAEAEEDDDDGEEEKEDENFPSTGKYHYHLAWHSRHHVATQTTGPIYLD